MTPNTEYRIINDSSPAIETELATFTGDGWRPILMSTVNIDTAVRIYIVLERPIPAPYTK
jgi:hypothetical protein